MPKKTFKADIATGADRFFSVYDQEENTQGTQNTEATQGTENTKDIANIQNVRTVQDVQHVQSVHAISSVSDVLDVQDALNVQDTQDISQPYRINLKLRPGHKDFLADEAWRQRISITELLNRIIDAYRSSTEDRDQ